MEQKKTVLLCDDNQVILFMLKKLITVKTEKLKVITAIDGIEALKIMRNQPIDYLITDIEMPHMDGWQLIENLKIKGFDMKKVVVISAQVESKLTPLAQKHGILKYYLKPIMPEDIEEIIRLLDI